MKRRHHKHPPANAHEPAHEHVEHPEHTDHPPAAHHPRRRRPRWLWLAGGLGAALVYWYTFLGGRTTNNVPGAVPGLGPQARAGDVMSIESVQTFSAPQATALIRQNYGASTEPSNAAITKVTFSYRLLLPTGTFVTAYARAYVPSRPSGKLPIFAFAPGTTGIGDKCAASLEVVGKANWGNYDSHMAAYAAAGYVAVITDYEGMRDPSRIHHYMVGELEGRAVLDSVLALDHLPETENVVRLDQVFLGGYSQGGHAAFWADKLAPSYAPQLRVRGVVGFGPVLNVEQTLADVAHAANINWFGPYVLYSFGDYYHADYDPVSILLPHWADTLKTDVPAHCIDSDIPFWGHNPAAVYTPEFLAALTAGNLSINYPQLAHDLAINAATNVPTTTPKRINQGQNDNVVLPSQAQTALPLLCHSSKGPVQLQLYPNTTHYDDMAHSFKDTLAWMAQIQDGATPPTSCPPQ